MKTLVLMRHGKAKKDARGDDEARPLTKAGLEMGGQIARSLKADGITFDVILSSTAVRALETAAAVAREHGLQRESVERVEALYRDPAVESLLDRLRLLEDGTDRVLVVGHNPYVSKVASALVPELAVDMPCCGVCVITFDTARWAEVAPGRGRLSLFRFPRAAAKSERMLKAIGKDLEVRLKEAISKALATLDASSARDLRREARASAELMARRYMKRASILTATDVRTISGGGSLTGTRSKSASDPANPA